MRNKSQTALLQRGFYEVLKENDMIKVGISGDHMNNWGKKYLSIMIVSLMVVFLCVPMHAASQEDQSGLLFGLDGYHMISSDGTKTGYGYDFRSSRSTVTLTLILNM